MKTDVVQKVIVLNSKDEMLMVRRSKTDVRRPLQWDLPGGMREPDEELINGAARELEEETGLKADSLTPVFAKSQVRSWKDDTGEQHSNVVFIFYATKITSSDITLSYEHDTFQWKAIAEAIPDYEYPLHREVLTYLDKNHILKVL